MIYWARDAANGGPGTSSTSERTVWATGARSLFITSITANYEANWTEVAAVSVTQTDKSNYKCYSRSTHTMMALLHLLCTIIAIQNIFCIQEVWNMINFEEYIDDIEIDEYFTDTQQSVCYCEKARVCSVYERMQVDWRPVEAAIISGDSSQLPVVRLLNQPDRRQSQRPSCYKIKKKTQDYKKKFFTNLEEECL